MNRLLTVAGTTLAVALWAAPGAAQVRTSGVTPESVVKPLAAVRTGSLEGIVRDDRGAPVAGAAVSAIGPANKVAIAGEDGRFRVGALPPGPYIVRAHLVGYTPSRRQVAEVRPSTRTTVDVSMHKADSARILAAGMVSERSEPRGAEDDRVAEANGNNTELAWRLRHLQRSVLKERTDRLALAAPEEIETAAGSPFFPAGFRTIASAVGSTAGFASTLFGNLDLSGEINLLTAGSFNGLSDLDQNSLQRAVAYLSLHGTVANQGAWTMQGIVTQGEVGSWLFGGSYRGRSGRPHVLDIGASFSSQRFVAGADNLSDTRSAGVFQVFDRWTINRSMTVVFGGRFATYSYLGGKGLLSPSVTVMLMPRSETRFIGTVSQRALAPGAEEFAPPLAAGLWVPPARTFDSLDRYASQRTRHFEMAVERDVNSWNTVAVRGFYQRVDDQRAAIFGLGPSVVSHYSIVRVGDVDARGFSVGLSNSWLSRTRGTVTYGFTTADWSGRREDALLAIFAPSALRGSRERLHDLTTSLETELPAVDTRLVVLYRVNTAFSRQQQPGVEAAAAPVFHGRFDLQVTQPLKFLDFTAANWQVLLAFRNLFREGAAFESVYDELLVISPPKRVVGGVLVRF
ncbi:MAG: TonB-dependent receptor domain-containing protein [Vicinamibacterales bacterium]